MEWYQGLFCFFFVIFGVPFLEYGIGYLLSYTRFNKSGVRMMALSGVFPISIPFRCKSLRCWSCRNWTCPYFRK